MSRTSISIAALIAALSVACEEKPPAPTAGSASSSGAATTASAPAPPPPPAAKPPALDLEALKKALKCNAKSKEGPCAVVEEFGACKPGWSPITPSGDGRWMGKAFTVGDKPAPVESYILLRARRVGLNEVAPGQLGVKIGITNVPDDEPQQNTAAKAVRALSHGDVAKNGNRAIDSANERSDWPEAFVQQAEHDQIYVAASEPTYLCGDGESQRLFVVRMAGGDQPGAGLYATMYPIKW